MVHNYILKTKNGKFLTMKKLSDSFELHVEDLQNHCNHAYLMHVKRRCVEKAQCLFYIEHENFYYIAKVHEEKVVLEKCVLQINFEGLDDSHWFEKMYDPWNIYCKLESVSKPGYCLCIMETKVCISRDQNWFLVKETQKC